MLPNVTELYAGLQGGANYLPCISLMMPFEPKMNLKTELSHKLKCAVDKIENELLQNYPEEKALPVLKKLQRVIRELNYDTYKKSVAIFVSPLIDKVYYLDMPVDEKIIIDESFEIRDLVYSKKEIHKYLLAVLSAREEKVYLGNDSQFIPLVLNVPDNIESCKNDMPEKVANFGDESKRKENLLDKFLHHIDNGLSVILQAYKLPLFVMGTARTIGHFKTISHNTRHIIDYIPGNYEEKTEAELLEIMKPHVADWKKIAESGLLKQLDNATSHKKIAIGIKDVWQAATQKRGRLLLVEKNFIYPARHSAIPEIIFGDDELMNNAFFIKDAVDDVIEKVLAGGGDVEFVSDGLLKDYQRIALIEYYVDVSS